MNPTERFRFLPLALLLAASSATAQSAPPSLGAPPPNDARADATPISGPGTYLGSNADATAEPGEEWIDCMRPYDGRSVWWAYTAPNAGELFLDLEGTPFDAQLSLHGSDGSLLGCGYEKSEGRPIVPEMRNVPVEQGETYLIRVAALSAGEGAQEGAALGDGGAITLRVGQTVRYTPEPSEVRSGTSGTLSDGATFSSPNAGLITPFDVYCTEGDPGFAYTALRLRVGVAGVYQVEYTLTDVSGALLENHMLLYEGAFDPTAPCAGHVGVVYNRDRFVAVTPGLYDVTAFAAELSAGTEYTLVLTSYQPGDTGTYEVHVLGPDAAMLAAGD